MSAGWALPEGVFPSSSGQFRLGGQKDSLLPEAVEGTYKHCTAGTVIDDSQIREIRFHRMHRNDWFGNFPIRSLILCRNLHSFEFASGFPECPTPK